MKSFKKIAATTLATAVVVSLGLASCGSSGSSGSSYGGNATTTTAPAAKTTTTVAAPAPAGGIAVSIKDFAFSPASLTVKVGDTVTWTNNDTTTHTASSDDSVTPKFGTGDIKASKTGTVTFDKAGTYAYHCDFHGNMHGTIVVTG